ncbi:hypothetical protein [Actinoplanes nipponensis]|nr:hypothetical protein [Actinoplanes nipponensis]
MPGDPHPRSGHRASPAGGLALLTPQSLVRQAQAGQARARQAIIRQALARRGRTGGPAHAHPPAQPGSARRTSPLRAGDRHPSAREQQASSLCAPDGLRQSRDRFSLGQRTSDRIALARDRISLGQHTSDRIALVWQAARLHVAQYQTASAPAHAVPERTPAPQHRIAPGLAVSARQRHAAARRAPHEPQQALQTLLRGLAGLIVLAIVGLSGFFVVAEESRGPGRASTAAPGAEPGIASRQIDPEPLTQREVFPEPAVRLAAGAQGYQITMTHSDTSCGIATVGELGALLADHGCDQVVRARLTAPYGGYQVTAGLFNLADESGAAQVSELTGPLVESGRGTFATLGGTAGDPLAEPLAQVGWHHRGHYLLYCVVARPDGQLVADDDPYAARITDELVQRYLGERVVGRRTLHP